jgi:hypothetical protein
LGRRDVSGRSFEALPRSAKSEVAEEAARLAAFHSEQASR